MKKALVVAIGLALAGCQSVPEKGPQSAAEIAPSTVVVAPANGMTESASEEVVQEASAVVAVATQSAPAQIDIPAVVVEQKVEPVVVAAPKVSALPSAVTTLAATSNEPPELSAAKASNPRMLQMRKFIYTNSGARQVVASDNPKAHDYHERAKALYRQAAASADEAETSKLLTDAFRAMSTAYKLAKPKAEVLAEKNKADFDKLQRSIDAFMEVHPQISEEKGKVAEGESVRRLVSDASTRAKVIFDQGNADDSKRLLRGGFEMLRDSIAAMRGGDTLVRSLNFATKKDEYDYELERYKSQRLLVDVLLESKRKSSAYVAKQVDRFITVAEAEREKAETAANQGDHESAITLLEAARKQIVRALRTGGIYVPG